MLLPLFCLSVLGSISQCGSVLLLQFRMDLLSLIAADIVGAYALSVIVRKLLTAKPKFSARHLQVRPDILPSKVAPTPLDKKRR